VIVEFIMGIGSALVAFFTGLFPDWEPPGWLLTLDEQINGLAANVTPLGAWADFPFLATVAGITLGTYIVCFVIKLVLRAASHSPVSGGAG